MRRERAETDQGDNKLNIVRKILYYYNNAKISAQVAILKCKKYANVHNTHTLSQQSLAVQVFKEPRFCRRIGAYQSLPNYVRK